MDVLHIQQLPSPMNHPSDEMASMEDSNLGIKGLMGDWLRHDVPYMNGYVIGHHI